MKARPPALGDLAPCFSGVVPSTIATCSPEGVPNITYLSVVHLVDEHHIGLSYQFFNKTRENVLAQPRAQVLVIHPGTYLQYRLDVRYVRTEDDGPVFERMRTNLDAVASMTGMTSVFRLRGADVYEVTGIEALAHDLDLTPADGQPAFVAALETLSARLAACEELEPLLRETLAGLAELFDYPHAVIFLADGDATRLVAVASRGFAASGIGAEVAFGDGVVGIAAAERRPVRLANVRRDHVMALAVRATAEGHDLATGEIPLPGLPQAGGQLAVPLVARGRTLGVIFVESPLHGRLTVEDERALGTLARYLATSILLLEHAAPAGASTPVEARAAPLPTGGPMTTFRHHASDDSIFVDDEYLIKGLSGRILVRLLGVAQRDGRVDFTNKELRLDLCAQHAGARDNLEARLILLRRRLEERGCGLQIRPTGRGRFRLLIESAFELQSAP